MTDVETNVEIETPDGTCDAVLHSSRRPVRIQAC